MELNFENMRCSEYRIHNGEENILFYLSPGNLTSTTNRKPIICAALRTESGILNFSTAELYLDDNKTQYNIEGSSIQYTPFAALSFGSHRVRLFISDSTGNPHQFSWSFIVEEETANFNFYLGIPHSHTSYSDGHGTPTEAYEKAKANGLNFLIITDHQGKLVRGSFNYDNSIKIFGRESPKWDMLKLEADFINNKYKDFLALCGYELNTRFWGHINIINSKNLIKKKPCSIEELYDWLNNQEGVLISINHPYRSPKTQPFTHNLDNFVNLYEVANGSTTRVYTRAEELYFRSLDEGWHIAAINGQDNHIDDWGISSNATAVIAKKLSTPSIIEAIKLRRVYSTESRTLKLTVKGNNQWMGSIINLKRGAVIELYIHCEDTINPIDKLQVITNGGKIISEKSFNSSNNCTWEPVISVKEDYTWYVIKVIHTNGQIAMSSAIFVENIKLTG